MIERANLSPNDCFFLIYPKIILVSRPLKSYQLKKDNIVHSTVQECKLGFKYIADTVLN